MNETNINVSEQLQKILLQYNYIQKLLRETKPDLQQQIDNYYTMYLNTLIMNNYNHIQSFESIVCNTEKLKAFQSLNIDFLHFLRDNPQYIYSHSSPKFT